MAAITIADRGPGIAEADRERAVRRFVRLEASRTKPGTGLGLSLVAAVARLHDGTLGLEDNHPGLRVVLSLPMMAPLAAEDGAGSEARQNQDART
jgi:signal transduction histidine kinase